MGMGMETTWIIWNIIVTLVVTPLIWNIRQNQEELKKLAKEAIAAFQASLAPSEREKVGIKDMGKVMGELKKLHADEIDFAKAGPLIKELLNK